MGKLEEVAARIQKVMRERERIRNIGIVAHIDHGKTTLTDNLVAAGGLMSEELAGKQLMLDFYEPERERGITIMAANISIVYDLDGKDYLVNIIDTPGHVDFAGEVVRAMRAVDGVILVVDAVEGVMPQTETVLRMALKERVKPVLFINKVDRLINELQLEPQAMQERFVKIINDVNNLIYKYAPEEFRDKWQVSVQDGSVAFGSAYHNWALSVPYSKISGITFKDVYEYLKSGNQKELAKKSPLYDVVIRMVIQHLPDPVTAQRYRIPHLWPGDINSEIGQAMLNCDPNGKLVMVITDVSVDPHAGEVATGRVFSGTLKRGMKVKMIGNKTEATVQQISIYMGPHRLRVEEIPAGNIAAIVGLKDVWAGETLAEEEIPPFESFKTNLEPVISAAVEAKNMKDIAKLGEVLRKIMKEDPSVRVEMNQETGEYVVSGMGELHLEIIKYRIENDYGIPVNMSPPTVVYREGVGKKSETVESKSPNRHNKFYIHVEPLEEGVLKAILEGEIPQGKYKEKQHVDKLVAAGMDPEDAKNVWAVYNGNVFVDRTRGVQYLHETKELIIQAFQEAMDDGPLAREKVMGVKVVLDDAVLHEDAVHRGPAQVIPAVKRGIYAAMLKADPFLWEPKQYVYITVPQEYMGDVNRELQMRRAQIEEIRSEGESIIIKAKVPVREMIGFSAALRSATQGRAIWTYEFAGYERVPRELQDEIVKEVRTRKGESPEPPKPEDFLE
ncbi:MAG: elongation factor EF-2 [Candidatus Diapherotrites archaeon]|nr:elongation factor EF-2 [Candidatus Diapherotrites archaeon]